MTLVAYNKRATDEMRERTPDLPDLQVRTLNSLGLSIVSRSVPVTTIDEGEVRRILDGLVDLPRRANTDAAVAWIEALSAVRLGLQAPAEVEAEFGGDVDGLPEVFDRYRRLLADRRLVDFDEQVYRAIEVLLTDPAARKAARHSCRAMLVDEFQDLTPAHLLLVRLLAGPEGAVFGVGDDDQTIYGYSGASPEWLIDFRRFFPTAGEHPLHVNYRCPVSVVEAARTLLTHNQRRVQKRIVAAPGRARAEGELEVMTSESPLTATVDRVRASGGRRHRSRGCGRPDPGQRLAGPGPGGPGAPPRPRTGRRRRVVPVAGGGAGRAGLAPPGGLLARAPGRYGRSPGRPPAVAGPVAKVVEWMGEQSGVGRLERLAGRLNARDADKITGFVSDLKMLHRRAAAGTTAAVLRAVRDDIGLDRAMELLEGSRRRLDRSAQTDDLDALVAFASLPPGAGGFRGLAQPVVAPPRHRRRGRAVDGPPSEGPGVAARGAPRGFGRPAPPSLGGRHRGRAQGVPCGADPRLDVGVRGRRRGAVAFLAELSEEWTQSRRPVRAVPSRTAPALPGPHRPGPRLFPPYRPAAMWSRSAAVPPGPGGPQRRARTARSRRRFVPVRRCGHGAPGEPRPSTNPLTSTCTTGRWRRWPARRPRRWRPWPRSAVSARASSSRTATRCCPHRRRPPG